MTAHARLVKAPDDTSRAPLKRSGDVPAWIATPTAERIIGALNFAQATADVAVIFGSAGTGKTWTAREYSRRGGDVWHATMTPATSGIVPALEEICAAIGIPKCNGAAALHRSILLQLTGTDGLLIVDEAHHLSATALDQVRAIHDAAGVGLVLMGSHAVFTKLTAGEDAAAMDRLRSRVGRRLRLDNVAADDVAAFADAWGIHDARAIKTLTEISQKPGALRVLCKTLRLASIAGSGQCITDAQVRAAWRELGGA